MAVESASWVGGGFRSPAAWLAHLTGESFGQCKLTLHLAERLPHMPLVRAAFAAGELAESALRLLAVAWHPSIAEVFARDEEMLAAWAVQLPFDDFRKVLEAWRMHADPNREERTAQERFDSRRLSVSELMDGMAAVDGLLDPEGYLIVSDAIRALSHPAKDDTRTAAQRRADALVMLAKFFIEHQQHATGDTTSSDDSTSSPPAQGSKPSKRSKRSKAKVVATSEYHDMTNRTGGGTIESGTGGAVVPIETIRRWACDAGIHRLITAPDGTILDYGRQTRNVSDPLFDVLLLRDHGCRWAGCTVPAGMCDAHHALHWLDDGETEPDNLVLLCWYHHHLLHEQHWSIQPLGAGHFQLTDPHGGRHHMRPPMIGLALPRPLPLDPPAHGRPPAA